MIMLDLKLNINFCLILVVLIKRKYLTFYIFGVYL